LTFLVLITLSKKILPVIQVLTKKKELIPAIVQKSVKMQQKYTLEKNLHSRGMKSEPKEEQSEQWTKHLSKSIIKCSTHFEMMMRLGHTILIKYEFGLRCIKAQF
jgi:uncharacterized protein YcsI (UPF0317 family)